MSKYAIEGSITVEDAVTYLDTLPYEGMPEGERQIILGIRKLLYSIPQALIESQAQAQDSKFIRHIQAHLSPGLEVVCKVCGKTAKQICAEPDILRDEQTEGGS